MTTQDDQCQAPVLAPVPVLSRFLVPVLVLALVLVLVLVPVLALAVVLVHLNKNLIKNVKK